MSRIELVPAKKLQRVERILRAIAAHPATRVEAELFASRFQPGTASTPFPVDVASAAEHMRREKWYLEPWAPPTKRGRRLDFKSWIAGVRTGP